MCTQVERRLKCRIESVPEARSLVSRVLDEAGIHEGVPAGEVRDDALLVATELLANAVRACRKSLTIRLEVHRTWLKVAVTDDSPAPARRRDAGPSETHGRGVDIVAKLTSDWGQTPWNGRDKTVWGRLDLPAGATLALACSEI